MFRGIVENDGEKCQTQQRVLLGDEQIAQIGGQFGHIGSLGVLYNYWVLLFNITSLVIFFFMFWLYFDRFLYVIWDILRCFVVIFYCFRIIKILCLLYYSMMLRLCLC